MILQRKICTPHRDQCLDFGSFNSTVRRFFVSKATSIVIALAKLTD